MSGRREPPMGLGASNCALVARGIYVIGSLAREWCWGRTCRSGDQSAFSILALRRSADGIAGQNGETAAITSIPACQNRTNYPESHRSSVIAGQNWRYSPLMTLNNGNSTPGCGSGAGLRAADVDDRGLRNRAPNEATGGRTQAHRDGKVQWIAEHTMARRAIQYLLAPRARGGRTRVGALVAGPTARQGARRARRAAGKMRGGQDARRARCASGGPGRGVGA